MMRERPYIGSGKKRRGAPLRSSREHKGGMAVKRAFLYTYMSPDQLQRDLQLPVVDRRAGDGPEGAVQTVVDRHGPQASACVDVGPGVLIGVRDRERGVVQDVESLKAELQLQPLGDGGRLGRAEVEAGEVWAAEDAAAGVAEHRSGRVLVREGDGVDVPPGKRALGPAVRVLALHHVAEVLFPVDVAHGRVGAVQAGDGESRADIGDAADLPAS